jgi:peptide-methionine (R)-S-oxide reductase
MVTRRFLMMSGAAGVALAFGSSLLPHGSKAAQMTFAVMHSDQEWHKILSADQFAILRQAATERPGSSPLLNEHRHGVFSCAGCNLDNFSSTTKFESGTGWPSFWQPIAKTAVTTLSDKSLGMDRTEVRCTRCGGHLGHVFDDGPKPTGLRYCMNGLALTFRPTPA